jgi:hypothetical protein
MPLAAIAIGAGVSGGLGYLSSRQQEKASKKALAAQQAEAQRARQFAGVQALKANELLAGGAEQQIPALTQAFQQAGMSLEQAQQRAQMYAQSYGAQSRSALGAGTEAGISALTGAGAGARQDVLGGQAGFEGALGQGMGALQQGAAGARGALSPLMGLQGYGPQAAQAIGAYDVVGRQPSNLRDLMGGQLSRDQAYAGFEADPGYQFRLQQGEQAINRAASARGGRYGGETLRALQEHGQNLASQEFGQFAQRRAGLNALQAQGAGQMDAQTMAALQSQAGREDQSRLAAQGIQANLAGMGYGAQGQLAGIESGLGQNLAGLYGQVGGQRATTGGQLGQLGMGIGQGVSGLEAQRGAGLSSLYGAQGSALSGLAQQGGQQQAGLQTALGTNIANIYGQTAAGQAQNLMGAAGASTQLAGAMIPQYQVPTQYAGQGTAAVGNALQGGLSNLLYANYAPQQQGRWF